MSESYTKDLQFLSDTYNMDIYAGSLNASRMAGQYVYPVQKYNSEPIEKVQAVQQRSHTYINNIEDLEKLKETHSVKSYLNEKRNSPTNYTNVPFGNKEMAQKGLMLDILG